MNEALLAPSLASPISTGLRVRVRDRTRAPDAAGRLSVVSGLCLATALPEDGHQAFLPDAVAPRDDWRRPTPSELRDLIGEEGVGTDAELLVVDLPGVARAVAPALASSRGDLEAARRAVRDVRFVEALTEGIEELIPYCLRPEKLVCQGPWVSPGGMRLVTLNLDLVPPRRIGLHVDNWDDLPLAERASGRRRLCVNLGSMPRHFVFLPVPLSVLVARGHLPPATPGGVSPAVMIRSYLGEHLEQLAVRVRVDPGEAYIVNADDVIHDGATWPSDVPDVALHFLGHFGAPPGPLAADARGEALREGGQA